MEEETYEEFISKLKKKREELAFSKKIRQIIESQSVYIHSTLKPFFNISIDRSGKNNNSK